MDLSRLLDGLTEAQAQAVMSDDPRILTVAVAGSGKTRVLTRRIVRLLLQGVPHDTILAVTFTRDAATEMRERIEALCEEHDYRSRLPEIRTFHSWGYHLVHAFRRQLGLHGEVTVYDDVDERGVYAALTGRTPRFLDRMKADPNLRRRAEDRIRAASAVTFDMIERFTLDALSGEVPGITVTDSTWGRWRHVLVDEYQDVNGAQALVVRNLAPDNVYVTGDAAQAIYAFRGAQPQRIRDLATEAGWRVIELDRTFRNVPEVVEVANHVRPDDLTTVTDRPASVGRATWVSESLPASGALTAVMDAHERQGVPWHQIAVLGRTWRELERVKRVLDAQDVPAFLAAPSEDPWNEPGPRLVAAGLRLARNPYDNELAARLAAVLLPEVDLDRIYLRVLRERRPLAVLLQEHEVWRRLGLTTQGRTSPAAPIAAEVNHALRGVADLAAPWTEAFLAERRYDLNAFHSWWMERGMAIRWREEETGDAVYLGTVHAAKGREWRAVVLPDTREGVYPPRRRQRQSEAEHAADSQEARRILYVAVTRARDLLYMVDARGAEDWSGDVQWVSRSPWLP